MNIINKTDEELMKIFKEVWGTFLLNYFVEYIIYMNNVVQVAQRNKG